MDTTNEVQNARVCCPPEYTACRSRTESASKATCSLSYFQFREQVINASLVVTLLLYGPAGIYGFVLGGQYCRFRCDYNSVAFVYVKPNYYRL